MTALFARRSAWARSGPRSPRRGRGRARRSAVPRSGRSTCGRRSATRPTARAGPRASRPASRRRRRGRASGCRQLDAHLARVRVRPPDRRGRSILSRSRPPPRGPLRSSAGAAAATRRRPSRPPRRGAARRSASAAATGRRSRSVIVRRDAEVGPAAARDRLDDVDLDAVGLGKAEAGGAGDGAYRGACGDQRLDRRAPRPCRCGTSPASRSPTRTSSSSPTSSPISSRASPSWLGPSGDVASRRSSPTRRASRRRRDHRLRARRRAPTRR